MRDRLKLLGKVLLQIAISCAFGFWLLSNPDLRQQLRPTLAQADASWVAAAILVYGAVEFFGAIRWQFLLRAFGFRLSWWQATRILLIGIFFNTLLPGLIAGDALRMVYLSKRFDGKKKEAILVVFLERVLGLMGLIFVGVSMILWRYRWLHQSAVAGYLTDLALAMVGVGAAATLGVWIFRRYRSATSPTGKGHSPIGVTQNVCLGTYTLLVALTTTAAAHLCYAESFYCSGVAFASIGPAASFADMMTVTPIVNTFTSIPISLSGVGLRESLFQVFLNDLCGVPQGAAVLVGSLGFLIRALWALIGCLLLACFGRLQWDEWTFQLIRPRTARADNMAVDRSAYGIE